jgi:hypothetical protein
MNKLIHWEIPSTDVAKSAKFYADLFGWKLHSWADNYTVFEVEDGVGGGISKTDSIPNSCIDVYVGVDDIAATLKRVEELGGQPTGSKVEIGSGMGCYAFFLDPCGCRIGLWSKQ